MNIRYPNGKSYIQNKEKANKKSPISYSNRGMNLEADLNETNSYYLTNGLAVIHKKPTPLQIVKVDYPNRSAAVVREAYFKQPSTTDYNGVYKGHYIDFEAKETKSKTSIPLQNFHTHQIEHMKDVQKQTGICFVLICFTALAEVYFVDAQHVIRYWDDMEKGGRKSIPLTVIQAVGYPIPTRYQPVLDYLKIIDEHYLTK
jgi:recombination protein U